MDAQTRSELKKEDAWMHTARTGLDWVAENRGKALRLALAVLLVILLIAGGAVAYQRRAQAASRAFGEAAAVYGTPLNDPAQPMPPGVKTFPTAADRARAAYPLFAQVAASYGSTGAGRNAQYLAGVTAAEAGNLAQAESCFRAVAAFRNADLGALGRFALANLLTQRGRYDEAQRLYQELMQHPATTVPKAQAQLQMAALYEAENKPASANEIYALLKTKEASTAAGQIAAQKLSGQH